MVTCIMQRPLPPAWIAYATAAAASLPPTATSSYVSVVNFGQRYSDANGRWYFAVGKVTVSLASHWPCFHLRPWGIGKSKWWAPVGIEGRSEVTGSRNMAAVCAPIKKSMTMFTVQGRCIHYLTGDSLDTGVDGQSTRPVFTVSRILVCIEHPLEINFEINFEIYVN